MEQHARRYNTRILMAIAAMVASFSLFAPKPALAGPADNVSGWLWSGTIGWISMNCTNLASCATVNYGANLTDVAATFGWADLKGWGWSETLGWVCFGVTCSGTTPEGVDPYAQYRDLYKGKEDEFWGWAKVEALGDEGWISLNCENLDECALSNYHVALDNTTGFFDKDAFNDNWGWGITDDVTGVGWVDFSRAETSWVLSSFGNVLRPEGVYEPDNFGLVGTHLTKWRIGFDGLFASMDSMLECHIGVPDGSTRQVNMVMPDAVRGEYIYMEYEMGADEYVNPDDLWYIEACRIGSALTSDPCAADIDCGAGRFCDEAAGMCRNTMLEKYRKWPIYTHGNVWSGLSSNEDQYNAIRCNAGFPGDYFNNAALCDFTGDASFSLVMRRGVPIEGNCRDGIDNDGNGQTDCDDRYCQGISYLCQTLPRTECVWGAPDDGMQDCTDPAYNMGELCCTRQPKSESDPTIQQVVNGVECFHGDPNDGYYDCDCVDAAAFDASPDDDCFAPGYQFGDLCCNDINDIAKIIPE